jgi:hypothetical protein
MIRIVFLIGGIALGVACAIAAPPALQIVRGAVAALPGLGWLAPGQAASIGPRNGDERSDSAIKLTEEQIQRAGIVVAEAREGVLRARLCRALNGSRASQ